MIRSLLFSSSSTGSHLETRNRSIYPMDAVLYQISLMVSSTMNFGFDLIKSDSYRFTRLCRFFYLSNFISFTLKASVPSPRYSFSKRNAEQLLFFSKIKVISLRFFRISYKIIYIGPRSKLINL